MVIANIVGIFLFLFFFWKILKEDYLSEKIFNLGFLTVFGLLVFYAISSYFWQNYWSWMTMLGGILGFYIGFRKQKFNFFEVFEGLTAGILFWIGLVSLASSVKNLSLYSFLTSWVCVTAIALFYFLRSHYRRFTWYKSGRVGFSGVMVALLLALTKLGSSIYSMNKYEIVFSVIVTLLLISLLYNLFRKKE